MVNGKEHFVGSSSSKMYGSIGAYKVRESANKVGLKNIKVGKGEISFEYNIQGALKNKRLRTMLVLDKCITKVKRGENSNKILQNNSIIVEDSSITIDEVMDILQEQATANIYASAGLTEDDRVYSSNWFKIKNRIPWSFRNPY